MSILIYLHINIKLDHPFYFNHHTPAVSITGQDKLANPNLFKNCTEKKKQTNKKQKHMHVVNANRLILERPTWQRKHCCVWLLTFAWIGRGHRFDSQALQM